MDAPCWEALLNYQQADEEGVMVLVSRQAIHECADLYEALRAEKPRVKKLVWEASVLNYDDRQEDGSYLQKPSGEHWEANPKHLYVSYNICRVVDDRFPKMTRNFILTRNGQASGVEYDSLDAAKAAAQADYERLEQDQ